VALASSAWRRAFTTLTPWRLIATGCLLLVGGAWIMLGYQSATGVVPLVSVADALWLVGYAVLLPGVLLLGRGARRHDVDALVDGAIIGFAALTATWLLFIGPSLAGGTGETLSRVVNTFYPVIDLALLTLVLRQLLDRSNRQRPAVLLALGLAVLFITNLGYLMSTDAIDPRYGRWLEATWVAGVLLLTAAAVLGSRAEARSDTAGIPPSPALGPASADIGPGRLLAIALGLAVPPVLAIEWGLVTGDIRMVVLGVAGLVMVALGTLRLGLLVAVVRRQLQDARALQATLAHQAAHDPVTDLPNRERFTAELDRALADRGDGGPVAVLFVDLDQFKAVNDTLGHDAGDRLLRAVAARIGGVLRAGDVLARFGGDEFVVLLHGIESEEEAAAVGGRVAAAVRTPAAVPPVGPEPIGPQAGRAGADRVVITATVGVVVTADPEVSAADVLRDADAALLEGKERGRDVVVMFASSMRDHLARWLNMEHDLRRAVEQGQLRLSYQPEIDLATLSLFGVEALLRWEHPEHGVMHPGAFLSVAESSGLIAPIGRWVIEEACRQARAWRDRFGDRAPVISVNVSPTHLAREDVCGHVERNLRRHHLPAAALRVEVTETALLSDQPHVRAQVQRLHDLGIEVAVDDFGTGFFSLSHLKGLAADLIKIDRSFVSGVGTDRTDDAIIHAVIDLSRRLGVRTIAEGVESGEQISLLIAAGCDVVQGFHYARPMSASELEARIDDGTIVLDAGSGPTLRLAE
jgi:diguanylate cyclase (GGDEF)-like protein